MATEQAGTFDIVIEKRATFSFESTFTQADGSPLDLTNRNIVGEIRRNFDNALEAEFDIVVLNATSGIVSITLSKEKTAALSDNACRYDIFSDNINSPFDSLKLLTGSVTIIKNITTLT
tara:strand:+ start:545 stop:901 length:357 start_codon:yes stop_codon:yes gene_type:complete